MISSELARSRAIALRKMREAMKSMSSEAFLAPHPRGLSTSHRHRGEGFVSLVMNDRIKASE